MKAIIDWIKANPLILGSAVVALLSVGWLVMTMLGGGKFVEDVVKRGKKKSELSSYRGKAVILPPEKPDMPARTVSIAVNRAAIDELNDIYQKIGVHDGKISGVILQRNEANHLPLDLKLFPDVDASMQHKLYEAKRKYQKAFKDMLLPATGDEKPGEVRLGAGLPPTRDGLKEKLGKLRDAALRSRGVFNVQDRSTLNEEDVKQIHEEQKKGLLNTLQQAAASIQIYAQTDLDGDKFPFQVDGWSDERNTSRPEIIQIWDSQIGLWIQQDIATAIMKTNQGAAASQDPGTPAAGTGPDAGDTPAPGDSNTSTVSNVVTNPIKRLIRISVTGGFLGINSNGALSGAVGEAGGAPRGAGGGSKGILGLSIPAKPVPLGDPNQRLQDMFNLTPTGRRSNPIYDVRHARVQMIVDVRQLPRFFNELNKINFMTVLSVSIKDVDEYEALRQGYYYGPSDVVEISLTLETIWFRQWTKKYMPAKVKQHLGIQDLAATPPTTTGS